MNIAYNTVYNNSGAGSNLKVEGHKMPAEIAG